MTGDFVQIEGWRISTMSWSGDIASRSRSRRPPKRIPFDLWSSWWMLVVNLAWSIMKNLWTKMPWSFHWKDLNIYQKPGELIGPSLRQNGSNSGKIWKNVLFQDSIINCVEVKASDFQLKLEAMRHTGRGWTRQGTDLHVRQVCGVHASFCSQSLIFILWLNTRIQIGQRYWHWPQKVGSWHNWKAATDARSNSWHTFSSLSAETDVVINGGGPPSIWKILLVWNI